jgi:tetratricopeptide (TPR) repeat protein
MTRTLPFAPLALRDLAAIWQKELSELDSGDDKDLRGRLAGVYLQILSTDPDPEVQADAGEHILLLHDERPVDTQILERVSEIANELGQTDLQRGSLERLATCKDPRAKQGAKERLGEILELAGDRDAAIESWRAAAQLCEKAGGQDHARSLYERVLDAAPGDGEAARRLVMLYTDRDEWDSVPELMGVVLRTDCERGCELLLDLAPRARDAAKRDRLVAMIDEAVAWVPPSSAWVYGLESAKVRALAAPPPRYADACEAFRTLVDRFGCEDDVCAYEAFIASIPDADERHIQRRFLYQWRAARDPEPAAVLFAWAQAEEAHGALEVAIGVYDRFIQVAPPDEGARATLTMAALLEDVARPIEARSALRRAVELPTAASPGWLSAIVQSAVVFPDEIGVWQAAEAVAQEIGQLDVVVRAYGEALARKDIGAELAEALGRRAVALEGDSSVESAFFVGVLRRVLELAPAARWSLDRMKLTLSSEARWEDLFCLYDRAIDSTEGENGRAELLSEAAFVAKDLAGDAGRAIGYLESLHALRPQDGASSATLERLYERAGRRRDLVEILRESACRSAGAARRQFQHRMAAIRLDLGEVEAASGVVETMLDEGAAVDEAAGLLERLASHPGEGRAVDRLVSHYESVGRMDDAVRLVKARLELAENADDRLGRVRELVRLRVSAARGKQAPFARVMAAFEPDIAGKPGLAQQVHKAVLVAAIAVLKHPPTDDAFQDAAEGAWRALDALKSALVSAGHSRRAARLLERSAHLPFDRDRRRELLQQAIQLCGEGPAGTKQAIRLYGQIFEEYATHPFATASLDRFARLLESEGEIDALARLWERQAQLRAGADEGASWLRAAQAWERHGSEDRAVAGYEQAAADGSEASLEALARIYRSRSQWADAVRVLERLCASVWEPGREGHALHLADAHTALGRRDRARSCLEEALRAEPTCALAGDMRLRLIDAYRSDAAWEPLASLLLDEGRQSEDPQKRVAYLREAAAVFRDKLNQPGDGAAALELALPQAPRDATLRLELAGLLESLEQWARAAEVLKECMAEGFDTSPGGRATLHRRSARALSAANDLDGALAQLQLAARLQPASPEILADLGRVALDAGSLDVAASAYRALLLVARNPSTPTVDRSRVICNLSRIAVLKGDPQHAASLLESALEEALDAGEDPAAFERGLVELGRADRVAATLERRIERASSLRVRAGALRSLAELWNGHLGREHELGARIRHHAQTVTRDFALEPQPEGAVLLALWSILTCVENAEAAFRLLPMSEGLVPVWRDAVAAMDPGIDRARLRVLLARAPLAKAEAGSSEAALALLSSALDELLDHGGPDAPEFVEVARTLGDALERADRREDAARHYESILDRRPARVETVRMIADRLEALGSARLADCYELWISLDSEAARLAPRLVDLRAALGDAPASARALVLGLAADPTNRSFVDRLAQHHEKDGNWSAVAQVLGRALDAAPGERPLLLRVVDAHQKAGATGEVLRVLDAAIAQAPGDPELLRLRAGAREAAGDDEGAAADLVKVGNDSGSVDLVVEMLSRIVERSASPAASAYAIGLVDVLSGASREEQAQAVLARLLERNPDHAGALERTASLAADRGAWDRAADAYARLVPIVAREEPPDAGRLVKIGLALVDACERAGRPGAARAPLESVLRVDPESAYLAGQSVATRLAWARLLARVGHAREALEVVGQNRGKRAPDIGAVYLEIGKAYFAKDELIEAFNALKAGYAVDPRCADLAMMLGLLAIDLGDGETAERVLLSVAMATTRSAGSSAGASASDKRKAFYHLAAMADARGEVAKANRWAFAAVREDPTDEGARALLDKVSARARPVSTRTPVGPPSARATPRAAIRG